MAHASISSSCAKGHHPKILCQICRKSLQRPQPSLKKNPPVEGPHGGCLSRCTLAPYPASTSRALHPDHTDNPPKYGPSSSWLSSEARAAQRPWLCCDSVVRRRGTETWPSCATVSGPVRRKLLAAALWPWTAPPSACGSEAPIGRHRRFSARG